MTGDTRVLPEGVHKAFMISNTLIYLLCKPLLRALAVPYEWMVPEHTQYALFQLYCDLRANPIKDRHWFEVHARRLRPHTFPGWIALGSALLYITSGAAVSMSVVLSLLAGTLYALVFLAASAGILVAIIAGLLAFSLFATACMASFAATGAAVAYGSLASSQAVLGWLSATLLPKPRSPFPDLDMPSTPHLSAPKPAPVAPEPVATPRAPLPPDPAPAVQPASPLLGMVSPTAAAPAAMPGGAVSPLSPPGAQLPGATAPTPVQPGPESILQGYTPDALDPIVEDAQLEAALAEQVANARAIMGADPGGQPLEEDDSSSTDTTAAVGHNGAASKMQSALPALAVAAGSPQLVNSSSANGHSGGKAGKQHHAGKQAHANGKGPSQKRSA